MINVSYVSLLKTVLSVEVFVYKSALILLDQNVVFLIVRYITCMILIWFDKNFCSNLRPLVT